MELIISFRCDILVQCSVITRIFFLFIIYPYEVFTLVSKLVASMTGRSFFKDSQFLPLKYTCLIRVVQGTYVLWAIYSLKESLSNDNQSKMKNILAISVYIMGKSLSLLNILLA